MKVWEVYSKTFSALFESAELAQKYLGQFGASIGGGMSIAERPIHRAAPSAGPAATPEEWFSIQAALQAYEDQRAADAGCVTRGDSATQSTTEHPAAHPSDTPRRFQPTTVGNMAVDKNGGYVSVDDYDLLEREAAELRAHLDRLTGMKFSDRMHAALVSRAETAERQRDEALKDAERYRWLRSDDRAIALIAEKGKRRSPASLLDAAIDAAKEKSNGK